MDKPAMDFISLPDDFKKQILKKLDWKSLKKLRLVCRDFYFLIEKNIQSLDKPKAHTLFITCDGTKICRANFSLKEAEDLSFGGLRKNVEFSDDDEYENFRKNIDFSKIIELGFRNALNNESIFVQDESYPNRNFYSYSFSGSSPNGRFRSCNLSITIENSREFGILYDSNFLRKESLRKLGIFEKNGLRSVVKKIAMDLLTGNPMLEYENIPTNTRRPLYIHITNHLFELGLLNPKERCGCKEFNLLFHKISKFGVWRQRFFRRFFDKIKFNNNLIEENNYARYSIKSSIKCSKCGVEHENAICYYKDSKELEFNFY